MGDKGLGRDRGDTVALVARVLGVSTRTVQRLAGEGMPGRLATGRYDVHAAAKWYFTREVERRMGRAVDHDHLIERLRLAARGSGDIGRPSR
jgi:phage terminase Nu1 subunit (DNA packaging protein)